MDAHDHLSALDQSRINWNVKVRVTRIWPTLSQVGIIIRHNMLLLDSENTQIHAISTPDIWIQFHQFMIEGTLCNIRNFFVSPATGNFRPLRHPLNIMLIPQTIITVVEIPDPTIPMHKFELKPLDELPEYVSIVDPLPQNQYSTDVIGVLEDLQPVQIVQSNLGELQSIRFTITDGRYALKVRLTGPLNVDAAAFYDNYNENPMVVILASTRIHMFKGHPIIYNLPSTKIYINLDCPEVFHMRQRLINEGFPQFFPPV